jgi:hypothetical protein
MSATITIQQPTTAGQREVLQRLGFVHATGLREIGGRSTAGVIIGDNLPARYVGRWDHNNGRQCVTTLGGEVWIRTSSKKGMNEQEITDLCPNGQGCYVPCSNGESIAFDDIMRRLVDPDWMPKHGD